MVGLDHRSHPTRVLTSFSPVKMHQFSTGFGPGKVNSWEKTVTDFGMDDTMFAGRDSRESLNFSPPERLASVIQ